MIRVSSLTREHEHDAFVNWFWASIFGYSQLDNNEYIQIKILKHYLGDK